MARLSRRAATRADLTRAGNLRLGIGMLAFASAHGHPSRLARHEQLAVLIALAGLLLLALSLVDTRQADHSPRWTTAALWLGASVAAALTLAKTTSVSPAVPRSDSLPLVFAGGDISAKLVVYGGIWLVAVSVLIVCYALARASCKAPSSTAMP